MVARVAFAVTALIVWPVYYAGLFIRWLIPWPLWPLDRAWAADDRLWEAFRNPPYIDRLRG